MKRLIDDFGLNGRCKLEGIPKDKYEKVVMNSINRTNPMYGEILAGKFIIKDVERDIEVSEVESNLLKYLNSDIHGINIKGNYIEYIFQNQISYTLDKNGELLERLNTPWGELKTTIKNIMNTLGGKFLYIEGHFVIKTEHLVLAFNDVKHNFYLLINRVDGVNLSPL